METLNCGNYSFWDDGSVYLCGHGLLDSSDFFWSAENAAKNLVRGKGVVGEIDLVGCSLNRKES